MKYKSTLTKPIKLAIIILLLFWIINFIVIVNSTGVKDATVFSIIMIVFSILFISSFVKGIYINLENNVVKYVHMFVLRRSIEIGKIKKIQKGLMGGFYKALLLVYEEDGKSKDIKILTITFKNDTLKRFVSDLQTQNPKVDIDQSVID